MQRFALPLLTRRRLLGGMAAFAGLVPLAAHGKGPVTPNLVPNSGADRSVALQAAINAAAAGGRVLALGSGRFIAGNLTLPGPLTITGVAGATEIVAAGADPILTGVGQAYVKLANLGLVGNGGGPADERGGLLVFKGCDNLSLEAVTFNGAAGNGLYLENCSGRLTGLDIDGCAKAGIFALDSRGLAITGNTVANCANGGILVWRQASGADGTIVSSNRISGITALAGGNGQNGNGINLFRADGVIVSNNQIRDCAFSAIRANSANDAQIRGNTCLGSGEVAIYSEFAFSGSLISQNIIDGAATGISMTNFNKGGRLAVCTGNLVRNILAVSPSNPDASPVGIYGEADTVISGNTIDSVPGLGIGVGYGPYLRNVLVTDNLIVNAVTGIGVSVAPGAGAARIAGNMISGAKRPIVGLAWDKTVSPDLAADAGKFPQLQVENNAVRA